MYQSPRGGNAMEKTQVMAFDLGASNGRAMIGDFVDGRITLHEVHRFNNDPVKLNNHLYWDFPRLFHELKTALIKSKNQGYEIVSVGIDTWGVDYGLIDEEGELIGNPVHYRDDRAAKGLALLMEKYDKETLKINTGMDCVSYNTVNQLLSDKQLTKGHVKAMLNMPDLFNYFLTGKMASEFSISSTSQLYDYNSHCWNLPMIQELQLPVNIFQEVIPSGTVVGEIKEELLEEMKMASVKVVAVTSHDTAAAIRSIPADEEDFLFIATGTWVIVGSKQTSMTMNQEVIDGDLTNEGGKFPNVNLLKNHNGLWILQESKRHWETEGVSISFAEMVRLARETNFESTIDILDERFFEPGNMPGKVKEYCEETGQAIPESIGEIVLVIEQSLAKQIAVTLKNIEKAVGKTYKKVYVFGGGVQDNLLCELIGRYSMKEVILGPKEATAFGNVLDQLIALGILDEAARIQVMEKSLAK